MKQIHKQRLRRLAEYLLTQVPKEKFDMSCYRLVGNIDHICGTAGCALGWSPAIMNRRMFQKYKDENGSKGVATLFEAIYVKYFGMKINAEWLYLFSGNWSYTDNTPQGAGARILYFLDHGVPDCSNIGEPPIYWDISHYQKYLTTYDNEVNQLLS